MLVAKKRWKTKVITIFAIFFAHETQKSTMDFQIRFSRNSLSTITV